MSLYTIGVSYIRYSIKHIATDNDVLNAISSACMQHSILFLPLHSIQEDHRGDTFDG